MEIKAEVRIVTKQLVDSLLAMNTKNRTLRESSVKTYCSDILAGKWIVTNQGIGVSRDGVLIDGQHRLEAIKRCDYPKIPILVVTGLDPEAMIAVDTGVKRSAVDILGIVFDERVYQAAPAIVRAIRQFSKKIEFGAGAMTMNEIIDSIAEYKDEISAACSATRATNFYSAAHLAGFVFAMKRRNATDKVVAFMRSVEDGDNLAKKSPQLVLRNYVVSTVGRAGSKDREERFLKTLRATEAFLNGETLDKLYAASV